MIVNGKEVSLPQPVSLLDVVAHFGLNPQAVAVERNGRIEPRDKWAEIEPQPDDKIELIRFVGGG